MKPRKKQVVPGWKPLFLAALSNSANVRASCRAAGVSRRAAYAAKATDADFAEAWADALEDACDGLLASLWTMARNNAAVAMWLLKAHKPTVFGDRLAGADGGPLAVRLTVVYEDEDEDEVPELLPGRGGLPEIAG